EENAQAKLVEIHQTVGPEEGKAFLNEVSEFFVEKNARLSYYKLQHELQPITHINTTQVLQKDHSFFGATTISLEGGLIRNNLNIEIAGEHCESFMTGLSVLSGKTHVDHHTIADHQVPHSYSNELYKGIFNDKATGVFNGKVFVRPQAQKTNAFQQNRNILLTDTASIYTKPQLEIWADDVKCSHGATTGQLDEDALFYLRTRGIPEERAKALLLTAFAGEVLERIDLAFFKAYCENYIHTRLSN
ncbi:MAG: Fe-S cluster assembly protein SufD, partial [Bacteroidota bacterium]